MRRGSATLIVGLLGAAFFFVPALAWVGGERAKEIENRPLTSFPAVSRGFDIFDPLTQWTTDHLPLRATAIRVNTRLSERLFNEAPGRVAAAGPVGVGQAGRLAGDAGEGAGGQPAADVVDGRRGWLFLTEEFALACDPQLSKGDVVRGLLRLHTILRTSGRRLLVMVPPDKSAIERWAVPAGYPLRACAQRAHRARIATLRRLRLPGFVDIQAALVARRRRPGPPLYVPTHSHWTDVGSVLSARKLAAAVDPRLLRGTQTVSPGGHTYAGELSKLTGDTKQVTEPAFLIARQGVSQAMTTRRPFLPSAPVARVGQIVRTRRTSSPGGAPLYPRRAVLYGDSFSEITLNQRLDTFFADITRPPELKLAYDADYLPQTERLLIGLIKRSKLLIYEAVERHFWGVRAANLLRSSFLDRLQTALSQRRTP